MVTLTNRAKAEQPIRELALRLLATVPQKNWRAEVARLFFFVRDEIRYTRDINGIETVQTPINTLKYRAGDCDDMSTLLASLLESIGFKTRFVAIGYQPDVYQHVYTEVLVNGEWVALDPTERVGVGWAPPDPVARMVEHT